MKTILFDKQEVKLTGIPGGPGGPRGPWGPPKPLQHTINYIRYRYIDKVRQPIYVYSVSGFANLSSNLRESTLIYTFMQLYDFMRYTVPGTDTNLQDHPCHLQYPEVQAILCLPSLQVHQGVQSDQLDQDDPGGGREDNKETKRPVKQNIE